MTDGKTTWVIGGGSGLGRAIALKAVERGPVYVSGRRENALLETVGLAPEGSMFPLPLDATDSDQLEEAAGRIVDSHGTIDSLVLSVGKAVSGSLEETDIETWRSMTSSHLDTTFLACKHALKGLRAAADGNILVIGSIFGLAGKEQRLAYCTVKGGLANFVKALALDLAGEVRVNSVCPGWVQTDMSMSLVNSAPSPEQALEERHGWHPMGRGGTPEEVAGLADFMMSPACSWMTGQNIALDGGYTAR